MYVCLINYLSIDELIYLHYMIGFIRISFLKEMQIQSHSEIVILAVTRIDCIDISHSSQVYDQNMIY